MDEKRTIRLYDPTAEEGSANDALALRIPTLDGKVVGLLDNTKDLVDVMLDEVQALLKKDYPQSEFRYFRKQSVSGATPEMLEQIASCDAVIAAVGD